MPGATYPKIANHHRRKRDPRSAPSPVTTPMASVYQVATNNGEYSKQCAA
jgi:hypothetical protein